MALVNPPNPQVDFINASQKLTTAANSFLTRIVRAINGTSTAAGVAQVTLGNGIVISLGASGPNGFVAGKLGDLYVNSNGAPGSVLYVKNGGLPGASIGWTAIA